MDADIEVPPQHLDSEKSILGGAIICNAARRQILSTVLPSHFYSDVHGNILRTIARLDFDGRLNGDDSSNTTEILNAIDATGIGSEMTGGITGLLLDLMQAHQPRFIDYHAKRVVQAATQRRLQRELREAMAAVTDGVPLDRILERLTETAESVRDKSDNGFKRYSLEDLTTQFPDMDPPLIDGWVRSSSVMNLISKSKIGKSWLAYLILLSVAAGWELFGMRCRRSRVLLLDNELKKSEIQWRMNSVASAMGMDKSFWRGQVEIVALRGNLRSITSLEREFRSLGKDEFGLIVVDALYRMMPEGASENDNAMMAQVYNCEDHYAEITGAAILNIHHSSKGDQGGKDVTDVGAGAGSQSRAADAHVVLRAHEEPDCVVMESAVRSFPPRPAAVLRWGFPLWTCDEQLDPEAVKGKRSPREEKQSAADQTDIGVIMARLQDGPATKRKLRDTTGIGPDRITRLLGQLVTQGKLMANPTKIKGNECHEYSIA